MLQIIRGEDLTPEQNKAAESSTRFTKGQSPFLHGQVFNITSAEPIVVKNTKEEEFPMMVFGTSVGNLFPSMLTRQKVDKNGNILTPKGSFVDLWVKTLKENPEKNDKQLLELIIVLVSGKSLKVSRRPYVAARADGSVYAASIVDIDIV